MSAPLPPGQGPVWGDDGFPPRSFPVETARLRAPAGSLRGGTAVVAAGTAGRGRPGRGRWIAAAAVLVGLLLLASGLLLVSGRGRGGSKVVASATSTTTADTSIPSSEPTTSLPTTTSSVEPDSTTVADSPSSTVAPAVLETSVGSLAFPKVNAADGRQTGSVMLRNSGATALSYTTQSSSAGLTASPARGTIPAGGSAPITVSLDPARITAEGPFSGTLTIGGTGGVKTVQVTSTVGRPPAIADDAGESCAPPSATCSRQIKLASTSVPAPSPCNTAWLYSVSVTDQSQITGVKALARKGLANADTPLMPGGQPRGFQSSLMAPLPAGIVLRFMIEATDQYGFTTRRAEQTITC